MWAGAAGEEGAIEDLPDQIMRGGPTYRILHDSLGSPRLLVSPATGTIARRMDFDEWGNVTLDTNPNFHPFGFVGGLYDSDTGLIRFGARDYDATTSRWITKDPIGFLGGDTNLFFAVGDDPVNYRDPLGLVRFSGGTEAQREQAYQIQKQLLSRLTPTVKAWFRDAYGIDIAETLNPCSNVEISLDADLDSDIRGDYDDLFNKIRLNPNTLDQKELFQAALLHELTHWAADMASPLGSSKPPLDRALVRIMDQLALEYLGSNIPGHLYYKHHSKQPYATEMFQFGDLVTLRP